MIALLGLQWRRRGRALLADGSESLFDIYEGTVVWDGNPRRVAVDEASTAPLVGMALLDGYELNVQVRSGGVVTINVLPSIERQLLDEPLVETRNRKPLRPNPIAPWELRVGKLRVFYEVVPGEPSLVRILAVGKKERNILLVAGQEMRL